VRFPRSVPRWLKPTSGLALLVGMVVVVDPRLLGEQLARAQWGWLIAALVAALLANFLCAYRWQKIAKAMPLQGAEALSLWGWFKLYLQGVSVNSVLPGGIIGGDVWRASQFKPLVASGQAVFLDRLAGLWGLFCLSALATLWPALTYTGGDTGASSGAGGASAASGGATGAGGFAMDASLLSSWEWMVWCVALAPFVLRAALQIGPVRRWKMRGSNKGNEAEPSTASKSMRKLLKASEHPLVLRSLSVSILSQWLTVLAFWFCMLAAGASLGLAEVTLLASAVFLSSLVPASVGGFGAREVGAVFFLGWVGVAAESALLGSVFFGLTATLQGLIGLVWWVRTARV
jgi:glycosyltransferase 2 family protein